MHFLAPLETVEDLVLWRKPKEAGAIFGGATAAYLAVSGWPRTPALAPTSLSQDIMHTRSAAPGTPASIHTELAQLPGPTVSPRLDLFHPSLGPTHSQYVYNPFNGFTIVSYLLSIISLALFLWSHLGHFVSR